MAGMEGRGMASVVGRGAGKGLHPGWQPRDDLLGDGDKGVVAGRGGVQGGRGPVPEWLALLLLLHSRVDPGQAVEMLLTLGTIVERLQDHVQAVFLWDEETK